MICAAPQGFAAYRRAREGGNLPMRIITGRARGTRLKTPRGMAVTRPTSDRVKESLFSILGSLVAGRRVLDVFAGTGSLGLEALSRGAAAAVLVDAVTAPLLRENVRRCHFEQAVEVLSLDAFAALARLERAGRTFDLVFCDPPYHKGLFERALAFFDGSHLLAENGILVVEHGGDEDALPELAALVRVDGRRYGKTTQLSFFQRRSFVEVDAGE